MQGIGRDKENIKKATQTQVRICKQSEGIKKCRAAKGQRGYAAKGQRKKAQNSRAIRRETQAEMQSKTGQSKSKKI